MPKARLTKTVIDQIPFTDSCQLLIRYAQLPGFSVRVGTRAKTYFAEGQVNRRTVRVTVGRADVLSPELVRKRAAILLGQMPDGIDPNRCSREAGSRQITLRAASDAFFAAKTNLACCTVDSYTRTRDLYLQDWSDRAIASPSRQMVVARHKKISVESGTVTANNLMRHLRSVYNFSAAGHEEFPPNPATILTQARA
jgi:hypothetical protein